MKSNAQGSGVVPIVLLLALSAAPDASSAADGGPLGIDHRVAVQNSGVWKRSNQVFLEDATLLVVAGGALWEGSDSRLGRSYWQAVDSVVLGAVTSEGMKRVFGRTRPAETDSPNQWFKGSHHRSFPSGEVMEVTTAVTPFVLEYGSDEPAVYALELLPLYDSIARVKVRAHWQSDVLASFAIGTAFGYYAHERPSALSVGMLPRGVTVGWKTSF
jgi:membrane-associated phospholipid phosphatase